MTSQPQDPAPNKPSLNQRTSFLVGTAIVIPIAIAVVDTFGDELKDWLGVGQPGYSLYKNEHIQFRYLETWQIQEYTSPQGHRQRITLTAPDESGSFNDSPAQVTLTITTLTQSTQPTDEQFYLSQKDQIESLYSIDLPENPPLRFNFDKYPGQGIQYQTQEESQTWEHLNSWVTLENTRYELDYRSLTTAAPLPAKTNLDTIKKSLKLTP